MYSAQVPTALGDYTVKAYSEATQNYFAAETTANFSIVKAYYDLSGIAFNNASYVYDKTEKALTITGTLPGGVSVQYTDNKLTNVGSTLATATFSGDTVNYYPIELVLNATLTITKAVYDMSGISLRINVSALDSVVREITINGDFRGHNRMV